MKPIELSDAPVTQLVMVSASHVSPADYVLLTHMSNDKSVWFTHTASDGGVIMRFSALGADFEEIEDSLKEYGFTPVFIEFIEMLFSNQFDAVHFDRDGDVIQGATWYTDAGQKVIPVMSNVAKWNGADLTDKEREKALEDIDEDLLDDTTFIDVDGILFNEADFHRNEDAEFSEMGFTHAYCENAFSCLLVRHNDDDTVDVIRVVSEG